MGWRVVSTAVEKVCWLLCVAEVRVASLCFIYSSLLALLWVCKRCSSKVLVLSVWFADGLWYSAWEVFLGCVHGKSLQELSHCVWRALLVGKENSRSLGCRNGFPKYKLTQCWFFRFCRQAAHYIWEASSQRNLWDRGKAPIMMCDRAAVKMISGFSESGRSSCRQG